MQLTCRKVANEFSPDDSLEFWKVDWPKEQLADPDPARVIYLFKRGYYPDKFELQHESPAVFEILGEWNKLDLVNKVLYRHILFKIEMMYVSLFNPHILDVTVMF